MLNRIFQSIFNELKKKSLYWNIRLWFGYVKWFIQTFLKVFLIYQDNQISYFYSFLEIYHSKNIIKTLIITARSASVYQFENPIISKKIFSTLAFSNLILIFVNNKNEKNELYINHHDDYYHGLNYYDASILVWNNVKLINKNIL